MNPALLLGHREVANTICWTLLANGTRKQDVQDRQQEVYCRALRFFRVKPAAAPTELAKMKALCQRIARNYAIDQYRKAKRRKEDLAAECSREEYGAVERPSVPKRDPVDTERQLEVLAELFREGAMPVHGVDILEGVASRCSYEQIGTELGITAGAVERRMRTMRKAFRKSMARQGMFPQMELLHVIVGNPSVIPLLREAA